MARQGRGQWPVVAVNGAVAGIVLVLVAVVALVVKPPAPPGISAFAPQASKPITMAPPGQSSVSGEGAGECAAGQTCSTPTPTKSAVATTVASATPTASLPPRGVPSALQCYTWPDGSVTQTFDPQSPPCIASWDDAKGNGGATAPGVTATEVRVALPVAGAASTWPGLKPVVDFVNSRFQLYGRKLVIVPVPSKAADQQAQGTFNDPATQRADAAAIVQSKVFATFDFVDPLNYSWSMPSFRDTLTKHKVISINGGDVTPYGTASGLEKAAPYEWTYYPTIDRLLASMTTMACRQLVGKPASHSSDRALRGKTRKWAIAIPSDSLLGGPLPGLSAALRTFDGCGVHDPKVIHYEYAADNQAGLSASFRQLAADGVTSVVYFPLGGSGNLSPMDAAARVNYSPEWLIVGASNYLSMDTLNAPANETRGAFGVGSWNKMPQLELEYWCQAYLAAGGDPSQLSGGYFPNGRAFYQELLLLASGVQMAGPHLTPQTFAAGLHATTFPNPGAGRAPTYQGTVGFTGSEVAMIQDFNQWWLDTRTTGREVSQSKNLNTSKATCYVGLGRRFTNEDWPTTDGYYRGTCR
jgi:hypothetical protein